MSHLKITLQQILPTGDIYCLLMAQIYPGSIPNKKIKIDPKGAHEYIHNFRLFQDALTHLGVEKVKRVIETDHHFYLIGSLTNERCF